MSSFGTSYSGGKKPPSKPSDKKPFTIKKPFGIGSKVFAPGKTSSDDLKVVESSELVNKEDQDKPTLVKKPAGKKFFVIKKPFVIDGRKHLGLEELAETGKILGQKTSENLDESPTTIAAPVMKVKTGPIKGRVSRKDSFGRKGLGKAAELYKNEDDDKEKLDTEEKLLAKLRSLDPDQPDFVADFPNVEADIAKMLAEDPNIDKPIRFYKNCRPHFKSLRSQVNKRRYPQHRMPKYQKKDWISWFEV